MKAVLEFNYPDDEDHLRQVMHASLAFSTLWQVDQFARETLKYNGDPADALEKIRSMVNMTLNTAGET